MSKRKDYMAIHHVMFPQGSVVVANGTRLESFGIAKQNTGICALENGRCTLQYRGDNLFLG